MRTSKNILKKLPVGTSTGRKAKKGNSTQTAKKPRSTPRYVEVKLRITAEDFARGQPYFEDQKYLSRYVLDAYREKLNRAESNDKAGRLRILAGNMDILLPVIKAMFEQGRLNFLKEKKETDNG